MRNVWQSILDLLFPPRCKGCGELLPSAKNLCGTCREKLHPVGENTCLFCGRDREYCSCDFGADLLFERAVSAWYYSDTGRALLHRFKFRGDRAVFDEILGRRFLRRVKEGTADIPLDGILFVPNHKSDKDRFAQTEYLAKALSKELSVPVLEGALVKVRKTEPQHKQSLSGRRSNVKGAFSADSNDLRGKSVLLVDDVATTFSTLNECTAALIAAGADRIICATLLTTAANSRTGGKHHE